MPFISFADGESSLVGKHPGFNETTVNTLLLEWVAEMPGQAISKLHGGGDEFPLFGHPAFNRDALIGDGALCQQQASTPIYINILDLDAVSPGDNGDKQLKTTF